MLFFGFIAGLSLWLLRHDSCLLDERLTILKPDQPFWDKMWLLLFYACSLCWLVLMPLDTVRWNWSHVPLWLQGAGVLALLCSLAGIFLSIRENRYLSPTVRLQRDRGHSLVDTGIYRSVRHPLYGSASLFYLAVPVLLGSELGFVVAPTFIGMLMLRTW